MKVLIVYFAQNSLNDWRLGNIVCDGYPSEVDIKDIEEKIRTMYSHTGVCIVNIVWLPDGQNACNLQRVPKKRDVRFVNSKLINTCPYCGKSFEDNFNIYPYPMCTMIDNAQLIICPSCNQIIRS